MLAPFKGRKAGSGDAPQPTMTPDTLRSKDTVEIILGMCEGKVVGPVDGVQSIYVGETPVQNPDLSYNFSDFSIAFWPGDAMAEPIVPKLGGLSNSQTVGVTLFSGTPVTRSATTGDIDHIDVRLVFSQLLVANTKGTFENTARFKIEYKATSDPIWHFVYPGADGDGVLHITGKTSSTFVKEYRFAVNRISEPWMIRVTKISPENNTTDFCTMSWESFQEIDSQPVTHDNTAILQIVGQASDQFSSIPDFWADMEGFCELKVPTNYDPREKTYDGIWDGTFKLAWTDNPAWFLYNYVINTQWGMSRFQLTTMDKFAAYAAAQWCDEQVPDGAGGTQARYTLNTLVTEAQSGAEFARYIAGTFNAAFYDDGDGTAYIAVDKDDPAIHLFGPENVVDGLFNYSFSDTTDRYNDLTVVFNNRDLNFDEDRRRVFSQPQIDRNGRVPLDFIAVGCTNEHEAIRRAFYKLITATTETASVNFRTNRQGRYVSVFDVILIADPVMGYGLSGRVSGFSLDRTTVGLRDPVYLEAGVSYVAQFKAANGVIQRNILSPVAGANTSLWLDGSLPSEVADQAVFDISQAGGGIGAPKPFRVMKVARVDGDPELMEITATEINRLKWAGADAATPVGTIDYSFQAGFGKCAPPTDIHVTSVIAPSVSGSHIDIKINWTNSPDKLVLRNHVKYRRNSGPWLEYQATKDDNATINNVPEGDYEIEIIAEKYGGTYSAPLTATITIGDTSSVQYAKVTGLALINGLTSTTFSGQDAHFRWNLNQANFTDAIAAGTVPLEHYLDPTFLYYIVNVYETATNTLVYTEHTPKATFDFTFEKNAHCAGGPYRTFRVEVGLEDRYGNQSPTFTALTVSNPAPATLTGLSVTGGFRTVFCTFNQPTDTDYRGVLCWMSQTSGFTPGPSTLVFDGAVSPCMLPADTGHTYYLRFAAYDKFGKTGLNTSSEITVSTVKIDPVDIPTAAIDATKFAAGLSVPKVVTTLPGTAAEGDLVVLTSDGQLYRYHSGTWTSAISSGSVGMGSFASGLTAVQVVGTLPTTGNHAGDFAVLTTDGKLYRYTSGAWSRAVDGGDIIANSITSASITAGAIRASQLFIGDATNLIPDPTFLDQTGYWSVIDPIGTVSRYTSGPFAQTQLNVANAAQFLCSNIPASDTNTYLIKTLTIPINAGKKYRFRADLYAPGSCNKNLTVQFRFFDGTGASLTTKTTPAILSSSYAPAGEYEFLLDSTDTVGAASTQVVFRVLGNTPSTAAGTGSWNIGSPRLERTTGGTLIEDGSISTNHIVAGAITAGTIQAGAIGAAQIAANAISASKLYIGDTTNMVLDPYFADTSYWTLVNSAAYSTNAIAQSLGGPSAVFVDCTTIPANSSSQYGVFSDDVTGVEPGTVYRARCVARTTGIAANTNKNLTVAVQWLDSSNAVISTDLATTAPASPFTSVDGGSLEAVTNPAPAGTQAARVRVYVPGGNTGAPAGIGYWYFASVRLERVMTGTAIADGAITTDKIAANSITAGKILAGTITTSEIAADTILAYNIAAGTITTSEIAAGTLTAVNIKAGTLSGDVFNGTFFNGFSFQASTSLPASGTMTYSSNPTNGQTTILNGVTFTFKTTPVNPTDVQIGGSIGITMNNFLGLLLSIRDPNATIPVTITKSGTGTVVFTFTYNVGGTVGNAYTLGGTAGTRSGIHLTGGSDSNGYLEMDGRAVTSGGHTDGPAYRVVDDAGTPRIIMGRKQDAYGLWIKNAAGTDIFVESDFGSSVIKTTHIVDNAVTWVYGATIPPPGLSLPTTYTSSTVWSQVASASGVALITISAFDNGYPTSSTFSDYRIVVGGATQYTYSFSATVAFSVPVTVTAGQTMRLDVRNTGGGATMSYLSVSVVIAQK